MRWYEGTAQEICDIMVVSLPSERRAFVERRSQFDLDLDKPVPGLKINLYKWAKDTKNLTSLSSSFIASSSTEAIDSKLTGILNTLGANLEQPDRIAIEPLVGESSAIPSHDKQRFVIVDAVERDGRSQDVIRREMDSIEHYPSCIILQVTLAPFSLNLSEKDALVNFVKDTWNQAVYKRKMDNAWSQRRIFWSETLKDFSAWLSVSNFVLIASIALCTAVFIAWLSPEILASAAPGLLGTAVITSVIGISVFPFFAAFKMYEHYNAWRFETWTFVKNNLSSHEATPFKNYLKEDWKSFNEKAHSSRLQQISYGDYLLSLGSQLWRWGKAHKAQATLVTVGLILSLVLLGFGIGFFLGNEFSTALLTPMLDLVNQVLFSGFGGFGLPNWTAFFTPEVGNVLGVMLSTALPLIIMDNIRRLVQFIWDGQQAGGQPLLMAEDNFHDGYDAEYCQYNTSLNARTTIINFWNEALEREALQSPLLASQKENLNL